MTKIEQNHVKFKDEILKTVTHDQNRTKSHKV